jgi:hypothetical protein
MGRASRSTAVAQLAAAAGLMAGFLTCNGALVAAGRHSAVSSGWLVALAGTAVGLLILPGTATQVVPWSLLLGTAAGQLLAGVQCVRTVPRTSP